MSQKSRIPRKARYSPLNLARLHRRRTLKKLFKLSDYEIESIKSGNSIELEVGAKKTRVLVSHGIIKRSDVGVSELIGNMEKGKTKAPIEKKVEIPIEEVPPPDLISSKEISESGALVNEILIDDIELVEIKSLPIHLVNTLKAGGVITLKDVFEHVDLTTIRGIGVPSRDLILEACEEYIKAITKNN